MKADNCNTSAMRYYSVLCDVWTVRCSWWEKTSRLELKPCKACWLPSLPAHSFLTSVEKGQLVSCRISIFWNAISVPAFEQQQQRNKEGNWMWRWDLRHLPPGLLCCERLELVTEIGQQTGSWGVWQTNCWKTRPFSIRKLQNICNLANSNDNSKKRFNANKCLLFKTNWNFMHRIVVFIWTPGLCR